MRRAALVCLLALAALATWLVLRGDGPAPATGEAPLRGPHAADAPESAGEPTRSRVASPAATDAPDAPSTELPAEPRAAPVLRVLTEDGRPVPGLAVTVGDATRRTDPSGCLRLDAPDPPAPVVVEFSAPDRREVEVGPGETEVRVPPTVPLDLVFTDAETGAALPRTRLSSGPPLVLLGSIPAPLWPGSRYDVTLLAPPRSALLAEGFAAPRPDELVRRGRLSRYAESAQMTIPLFRAMSFDVTVVAADGAPARGADVDVDGLRGVTGDDGRVSVRGVRFERRGSYRVKATLGVLSETEWVDAPLTPGEVAVARLVLPPPGAYHDGGSSGVIGRSMSGRSGVRRSTQPRGTASLVVRAHRRDGSPAARAHVGVSGPWRGGAATDATGTVRFDGLPGGSYRVALREVGVNDVHQEVEVADGETLRVVLDEPRGRTVRIEVIDAAGRPLPSARVRFGDSGGSRWVRLAGTRQHLDLFTDGDGRLRLDHFPAGTFKLLAAYGGRTAELWVREGEPARITIPD